MLVTYGQGKFQRAGQIWQGRVMLGDHKLYLAGPEGDIAATYIPLEKIIRVRRTWSGIVMHVRSSPTLDYDVGIRAARRQLKGLLDDLVARRGLRRSIWRQEWFDPEP